MTSRNQHPRQKAALDAAVEQSDDRETIGILFQLYKEFGHDMMVEERAAVRQIVYGLLGVGVAAAPAAVDLSMVYAEDVKS